MDELQPASGRFEGKAHLLPVRVYYEDTDFTGVVYHANYLRYFERGRSEFLRLTGVSHTELRALDQPMAFVVVRMTIDYRKAARIDDALIVRTEYERV
ncbi:MAG: YbgC/FadM family acyl-CoA thioesterase, partial [Phenylobacterium sp.]